MNQLNSKTIRRSLFAMLAVSLLGFSPAKAETVTFLFEGVSPTEAGLQIYDDSYSDLTGNIQDGKLVASYNGAGGFAFSAYEGNKITITAPTDITAGVDYLISDFSDWGYGPYVEVNVQPGANGAEFTVNISSGSGSGGETPVEKSEVVFNFDGPEAALNNFTFMDVYAYENLKSKMQNNSVTVEYTSQAYLMISCSDAYEILVTPPADLDDDAYVITPGSPSYGSIYTTIMLYPEANGSTFNVTLSEVGPVGPGDEGNSVSFTFDASEEALASLTIYDYNTFEQLEGGIEDNKLTLYYDDRASYFFETLDPYQIKITAPSNLVENVDYMITDYGSEYGAYDVELIVVAGANNAEFTVSIFKEGEEPGGEEPGDLMEEGTLLFPVVDNRGEVALADFGMNVSITYNYQPLTMMSSDDFVIATIINPDGDEFTIGGMTVPFDPSMTGDPSFDPGVEVPAGDTVLSFNIMEAAMPGFPFSFDTLLGEYIVNIPAGIVANENGELNPAQTFKFTVVEGTITYTDVTFTFEGSAQAMADLQILDVINYDYLQTEIANNKLTVSFPWGVGVYNFMVPDDYLITITPPADLTENVDYVIYEGAVDTQRNQYIVTIELYDGANGSDFNVAIGNAGQSGISTCEAVDGKYVVYNTQGIRVLVTERAEDLNTLQKGLYIINGKKIMINK